MAKSWAPAAIVPKCRQCQGDLRFVCAWSVRGLWGYDEVHTYECPEHGPIFVSAQPTVGPGREKRSRSDRDAGDRDSLVSAPRKPTPTLGADAIALREPD